ncbi:MAG TPA: sigma-70 family RNA polymerase sigma factor [Microthrixaceae bacterium]|nr:sigma-70 family RNA polymerase sigma factor [Microthrixaceae bacterium]
MARNFDEFYRAEFTGLVVLAVGVTGQRLGAEDLVQEAMLDAFRRWDRVGAYENPRAWVRKVVVQRAVKSSKKAKNERAAGARRLLSAVEPDGWIEFDPVVRDALLGLPSQQRAAMALHYLEDLSVRDTAELLGVADGTVKSHLARGRLHLGATLKSDPARSTTND